MSSQAARRSSANAISRRGGAHHNTRSSVTPTTPFPHLRNNVLHIGAWVKYRSRDVFGVIPVPDALPGVLFLPGTEGLRYIHMEELLLHHTEDIFSNYDVRAKCVFPRHAQRRHKPGGRGLRPGRERGLPQKDAQGAQSSAPRLAPCQTGAQREDRGRLPRISEKNVSPSRTGRYTAPARRSGPQLRLFPGGPAAGGAAPLADLSGVPALPLLRA